MKNEEFALNVRIATCEMLLTAGFGHLGASLSIVETLSVLFNDLMDRSQEGIDKDWFVLSKGHGGPSYYATLSLKGYFDESVLGTLNKNGTTLPSHPDRLKIPGVDATTGSLGQGISQAVGIARGLKIQGINRNVYCIVGDGEANEGQVYEALLYGSKQKLDNLYIFIDNNKKQLDGYVDEISIEFDFQPFLESMNYETITVNGRDCEEIKQGILSLNQKGKPKAIVLDTVKAQGIKYFEELYDNHHLRFDENQTEILKNAIEEMRAKL